MTGDWREDDREDERGTRGRMTVVLEGDDRETRGKITEGLEWGRQGD